MTTSLRDFHPAVLTKRDRHRHDTYLYQLTKAEADLRDVLKNASPAQVWALTQIRAAIRTLHAMAGPNPYATTATIPKEATHEFR